MDGSQILTIVVAAVAGVLVVSAGMRGIWWSIGKRRLRAAGPRPLTAAVHRLWSEPGSLESLDPVTGPGGPDGVPLPPFTFVEEHLGGSQPCVSVRDSRGRVWRVKWGPEVHSEAFAVRVAWACGYFVEDTHFVADGTIQGSPALTRARACVDEVSGGFCEARFELDDPRVKKLFEEHSWAWDDNPFLGTRELSGLKILVMLLSNWDSKDRRDVARGSNTAIFEHRLATGRREARYLISDWGGSMGRWGTNIATRARWDIDGFEAQTPDFVTAVENGYVTFGYSGQRGDVSQPIPLDDVRWFCPYLERLSLEFLTRCLVASGASAEEADKFARALRARIDQLAACSESRDDLGTKKRPA